MALRDDVLAGAVLLGALLLVGPLVYGVVFVALDAALSAAGVGAGVLRLAAVGVALALALYAASEVAELQLHGTPALWRGERYDVLARHAVLSLVALLGLLEAGWAALAAMSWALTTPGARPVSVLAALLVAAVAGALMLFGFAAREGYRRSAN